MTCNPPTVSEHVNGSIESGKCRDCGKKTVCTNEFLPDVLICQRCQKEDSSFDTVTKTTAKKEYGLTDKELANIPYRLVDNPHYKCAAPMTLYRVADIKKFYHENEEAIKIRLLKREERAEKRRIAREAKLERLANERIEKRASLVAALGAIGLELREDSRLCKNYENGELSPEWTLDRVVQVCAEMHFLHNYTDYPQRFRQLKKNMWGYTTGAYYWDRRKYMTENIEELANNLKEVVFKDLGGRPTTWPWLLVEGSQ